MEQTEAERTDEHKDCGPRTWKGTYWACTHHPKAVRIKTAAAEWQGSGDKLAPPPPKLTVLEAIEQRKEEARKRVDKKKAQAPHLQPAATSGDASKELRTDVRPKRALAPAIPMFKMPTAGLQPATPAAMHPVPKVGQGVAEALAAVEAHHAAGETEEAAMLRALVALFTNELRSLSFEHLDELHELVIGSGSDKPLLPTPATMIVLARLARELDQVSEYDLGQMMEDPEPLLLVSYDASSEAQAHREELEGALAGVDTVTTEGLAAVVGKSIAAAEGEARSLQTPEADTPSEELPVVGEDTETEVPDKSNP